MKWNDKPKWAAKAKKRVVSFCGAVILRKIAQHILELRKIDFTFRVSREDDYREFQVDEKRNKFENTISIEYNLKIIYNNIKIENCTEQLWTLDDGEINGVAWQLKFEIIASQKLRST